MKSTLTILIFFFVSKAFSIAPDTVFLERTKELIAAHQFSKAQAQLYKLEGDIDKFSEMMIAEYFLLKGVTHFELFEFSKALLFLEEAKQYVENIASQSVLHGEILLYIGLVNKEGFSNSELAREFYNRAIEIFIEKSRNDKVAEVNFQLARSFTYDEIDKREYYNLQAQLFFESDPKLYVRQLAECYNLEAVRLSYKLGVGENAITMFNKAIQLTLTNEEKMFKLGKYYDNLGYSLSTVHSKKSLHYLRLGLDQNLLIPDNNYWIASSYNNLAAYFESIHEYDSTRYYLTKFIEITSDLYGESHPEISNAYQHLAELEGQSRNDLALFYFRKALFLSTTSDSISETDLKKYEKIFEEQIFIYTSIVYLQSEVLFEEFTTTKEIGYLRASVHNFGTMHKIVLQKLKTFDWENSRAAYFNSLREFYRQYIKVLYETYLITGSENYASQVLDVVEAIRYVSIMENNRESNKWSMSKNAKSDIASLSIRGEFAYYQTVFDQSIKANVTLTAKQRNNFIQASRKYYALVNKDAETYTRQVYKPISEIIKKDGSKKDEIIVEYYDAGNVIYAILVKDNIIGLRRLEVRGELSDLIRRFQNHFENIPSLSTYKKSFVSFNQQSHDLYKILLKPFENYILAAKHLTIIPDGILSQIPYEALIVNNDSTASFRDADYLVKHVSIKRALTVSQLFLLRPSIRPDNILAMTSDLLPAGAREIKLIGNYFTTTEVTGASCKVDEFVKESRNHDFIHLAVHGKSDLSNPLKSSLIFNNIPGDTLFAYQLYSLDLANKFIVLSACSSGIGAFWEGEGVFSISRAFFYAGASALIVTLWSVDDGQTEKLFRHFYKNLAADQPPEESLRNSKLAYLDEADEYTAHPVYWAGLVIEGCPTDNPKSGFWNLKLGLITILVLMLIFRYKKSIF